MRQKSNWHFTERKHVQMYIKDDLRIYESVRSKCVALFVSTGGAVVMASIVLWIFFLILLWIFIIYILRCFVSLTLTLQMPSRFPFEPEFSNCKYIFALSVPRLYSSCFFHLHSALIKTRNNFAFDFDFVTWNVWSMLIRPIQQTFYHIYRTL